MEKTAKKIITTRFKKREFKNFYDLIQYYGYRKGMQNNITSYAKILINQGVITDLKIIYEDETERDIFKKKERIIIYDFTKWGWITNVYY